MEPGSRSGSLPPRFRSKPIARPLGLGQKDLLVTYIGRIAKEKNLVQLLAAWEASSTERGTAQLAW